MRQDGSLCYKGALTNSNRSCIVTTLPAESGENLTYGNGEIMIRKWRNHDKENRNHDKENRNHDKEMEKS